MRQTIRFSFELKTNNTALSSKIMKMHDWFNQNLLHFETYFHHSLQKQIRARVHQGVVKERDLERGRLRKDVPVI